MNGPLDGSDARNAEVPIPPQPAKPVDPIEISATLWEVMKEVHIDVGQVGHVFDQHKPASMSKSAASMTAGAANDADMVGRLVNAAHQAGFLRQFVLGMRALVSQASAATDAHKAKILSITPVGEGFMQAILDANQGLNSVVTLGRLVDACPSIGCLVDRERPSTSFGTAFLVADDIVLTCAHVVEAAANGIHATAGDRKVEIPRRVLVKFPNVTVVKQAQDPVEANLHADWDQLPSSPSFGQPPYMTIVDGKESEKAAAASLDYAFLRLATRPPNLRPLSIVTPPKPRETGLNSVIGFPNGGLACFYGSFGGQKYVAAAARVNHLMNTAEGMSGSPCLDSEGKVYGLQEGTVNPGDGRPAYNRAISLEHVIASLKDMAPGLFARRAAKLWLDDAEVRRSWAVAGVNLAGNDDWIANVKRVGDPLPESLQQRPGFHPLFPRTSVTDWAERALSPAFAERLLLIGGRHGAGKSFCRHVLASALPATGHRVVYLPHDAATNPDRLAVNDALRKVALIQPRADRHGEGARPIAGQVTHDEVRPLVQELAAASGSGMSWLFIDFRRGDGWAGEIKAFWTTFALEAAAEPSLRLIYAGLKTTAINDLVAATKAAQVSINPPDVQELREYITAFIPARVTGRAATDATVVDDINETLNDYDELLNANATMATVEAVRLIILLASVLDNPPVEGP